MRLEKKVAIVTGGASGIGRATSKLLADRGAHVILSDIKEEEGKSAIETADEKNGSITFKKLDVRDQAQFKEVVEEAEKKHQNIDILVNNAGISSRNIHENISEDNFNNILDVNVKGVWNGCQTVIPRMKNQGYGSIINISSIYGFLGTPKGTSYGLTKGAVLSFTRNLAVEVGRNGIRVNAICPGYVDTPLLKEIFNDSTSKSSARQSIESRQALKRIGDPTEIAKAIAFLASNDASFITGEALTVDGGFSVM